MTKTSSSFPLGRGGVRRGAGRKAGGQNLDTEDRKLVCVWLCEWFSQRLQARLKRPCSDSDCEQSINETAPADKPVFESQKATLGGMWAKARRGERPFSPERMTSVVAAADSLKFWNPRWRRQLVKSTGEADQLSLLLLSLISVEGLDNQRSERLRFLKLQAALQHSLSKIASCTESKFEDCRHAAIGALQSWEDFNSELLAGVADVREDVVYSIEPGTDDSRRWMLHPQRTIKRLRLLKFAARHEVLKKATGQIWALNYQAHNFLSGPIVLAELRKEKLAQNWHSEDAKRAKSKKVEKIKS